MTLKSSITKRRGKIITLLSYSHVLLSFSSFNNSPQVRPKSGQIGRSAQRKLHFVASSTLHLENILNNIHDIIPKYPNLVTS